MRGGERTQNEKSFATTLFTQLHCEGLFNIKGEYENLIERKGDGENYRCLSLTILIIHYEY